MWNQYYYFDLPKKKFTLLNLLQMTWFYITSFMICHSVWLFLCISKRYAFHIMMVCHILGDGPGVPAIKGRYN